MREADKKRKREREKREKREGEGEREGGRETGRGRESERDGEKKGEILFLRCFSGGIKTHSPNLATVVTSVKSPFLASRLRVADLCFAYFSTRTQEVAIGKLLLDTTYLMMFDAEENESTD